MKDFPLNYITSVFTTVVGCTAENVERIILLSLGILSAVISIGTSIFKAIKEAKKDGKITKEEIENIIEDTADKIQTEIDQINGGDLNGN